MSIEFYSDAAQTVTERPEHCLCAQMAPGWMGDASAAALRAAADPACPRCGGSGVETVQESDAPSLHWANDNARAVMAALGLPLEPWGSVSLPVARRAVMRGRARFERYSRPGCELRGAPRARGNVVELAPLRAWDQGMTAADVGERVEAFARFVDACAERCATKIVWS